jgi:hypothetical protein
LKYPNNLLKWLQKARCRWLTPVILATQEAEIRRIVVQGQSGQTVCQDPILKKPITKQGW